MVSKTPSPPGVWLASPMTWARRKKARKAGRERANESGMRTYRAVPASAQSAHETITCAHATPGAGTGSSQPHSRSGRFPRALQPR
jgi:hypothetical protein